MPDRHQIDNRYADALLKKGGDFPHELLAGFRPILVGWADDLDGGNELSASVDVVYANFVLVLLGQIRFDRRTEMDLRRGLKPGRKDVEQRANNFRRPLAVDFIPCVLVTGERK
ncbi:MAG TPA: hypothetical protein VHR66_11225 [Gemmataceae bacterium]|jgi:hypothetical protein|nr:hypothetical protein [Gemmataceae bacterium]